MQDLESLKQLAFDNAPIGIVVTENRVIRSYNQYFADLFGYSNEALLNQSFEILYPSSEEFIKVKNIGVKLLRDTNSYTDERIMMKKDGSLFWCRFRGRTLTRQDPLQNAVWSVTDLSEKRPYQQLTTRERQIVMHISMGRTSKEIARILGISPRTVEVYRSRLFKKFSVNNVMELLSKISGLPE